jgi:predicted outer membrane repeat protein
VDCGGNGRALTCSGTGSHITIRGLTFTGGHADHGGAVLCYGGANVSLEECEFQSNHSDTTGGAIRCDDSTALLDGCTFIGNTSYNFGGAVYFVRGAAEVTQCSFRDNEVEFMGGALTFDEGGEFAVSECQFLENCAHYGGGVACYYGTSMSFDGCLFDGNHATNGGGLYLRTGADVGPAIADCQFYRNEAVHGAGIRSSSSAPRLDRVVLAWNVASFEGGGIQHGTSPGRELVLNNVTCSDNEATQGAGMWLGVNGTVRASKSIVTFNRGGVGVALHYESGVAFLDCTDIYGNEGGDWVGAIAGQLGVGGNIALDPLFCDSSADDYGIHDTSPCAPEHSGGCDLIGAMGIACCGTSTEQTSWGALKAAHR